MSDKIQVEHDSKPETQNLKLEDKLLLVCVKKFQSFINELTSSNMDIFSLDSDQDLSFYEDKYQELSNHLAEYLVSLNSKYDLDAFTDRIHGLMYKSILEVNFYKISSDDLLENPDGYGIAYFIDELNKLLFIPPLDNFVLEPDLTFNKSSLAWLVYKVYHKLIPSILEGIMLHSSWKES